MLLTRALQACNQVGDEGACALGEGIKFHSNVRDLSLVSAEAFCALGRGCQGGYGMRVLTLWLYVTIVLTLWLYVPIVLTLWLYVPIVLTLWLQYKNLVGDAGACGLAEGLRLNSSLQCLGLVSSSF